MKRSEILHRGCFKKLHSKLHLTFVYAFIPGFYSIACLSKLRSIITSLALTHKYIKHRYIILMDGAGKKLLWGTLEIAER